ncbi:MAG: hypothetical protein Q9160_007720 [Pyrenula sp. 1 TL-2023]
MAVETNGAPASAAAKVPYGQNTQQILDTLGSINAKSFSEDGDRAKAVAAAYSLVSRLETPWESIARMCMGQNRFADVSTLKPAVGAALKIGKDLGLYEKWHEHGDKEMTSEQLAKIVGFRLLRHLAANHLLEEPAVGVFKPTKFTLALLEPVFGEWINHIYDAIIPCFFNLPEYFSKTGYKAPLDPADGVFQYAKSCKGRDMFDYYKSNPREGASFNHVMGGVMAHQASWLDIFPHERLLQTADPDTPLLVDVGGNVGHDMGRFYEAHPETAARLYLEDRPEVVKLSKVPNPVNKIGHDFFTPQPIKGARAYYLHGVLHDWPDEPALKILQHLASAMTPGYSTLLIHDHIAPGPSADANEIMASTGPVTTHPHTTAYDLVMMVMVAGKERSEAKWRELLERVGLEVVRVWKSGGAVQGIVEARLKG